MSKLRVLIAGGGNAGFDDITDWTVRLGRGRSFLTVALLEHAVRAHRAPIEEVAPPAFTAGRIFQAHHRPLREPA